MLASLDGEVTWLHPILFTSRTGEILRPGELFSSLPMNTKEKKYLNRYLWTFAIYYPFFSLRILGIDVILLLRAAFFSVYFRFAILMTENNIYRTFNVDQSAEESHSKKKKKMRKNEESKKSRTRESMEASNGINA